MRTVEHSGRTLPRAYFVDERPSGLLQRHVEPPSLSPDRPSCEAIRARLLAEFGPERTCPHCGAICDAGEIRYHVRACSANPDRLPRGEGKRARRRRRVIETPGEYAARMRQLEGCK